jgi:hypothetical protein
MRVAQIGILNSRRSAAALASAFRARVEADGGIVEAELCLTDRIQNLIDKGIWDKSSAVWLPHGYKESKLYAVKGGAIADFPFSRNGTRTRVNGSGLIETIAIHKPALDYTSDSTCPALSLEPTRTNSLLQSGAFETASWTLTNVTVTANNIAGPDNLSTADAVFETTATGTHGVSQSVSKSGASLTFSYSVFIKPNGRDWAQITISSGGNGVIKYFNVTTGALGSSVIAGTGFALVDSKIRLAANGFYRCELIVSTDAATSLTVTTRTATADGTASFAGDVTKGVFLYGAQLEAGSYATSYIPTTTATVTRNGDAVTALTGVSDLIGQTEGTLYFEGSSFADGTYKQISLSDGTINNRVTISFNNTNKIHAHIFSGGATSATIENTGFTTGTTYKVAIVYRNNYAALFVDGVKIGEDLVFTVPSSMSKISLTDGGTGSVFYGEGEALMLIKTALSDADAISLTRP